jgi:hypothetical protein
MDPETFTTVAAITREIRRPGKVYVGMLINSDVVYIAVEKADLIDWLSGRSDTDCGQNCGVYATRAPNAPLYVTNT